MTNDEMNIAITYHMDETEKENQEIDINDLLYEIENTELNDELTIPQIINYNDNFTVKELLIICEYYGFAKEMKANKFNKEQIIEYLVGFESDIYNSEIVCKRQNMWFYMNELKTDKFMKKFVLW